MEQRELRVSRCGSPTVCIARPAASLARLFKRFRARVIFRLGNHVANAGSFLSILLLSATFNTQLEVQATGEDEEAAIRAAEAFFQGDDEQAARQVRFEALPGEGPGRSS